MMSSDKSKVETPHENDILLGRGGEYLFWLFFN